MREAKEKKREQKGWIKKGQRRIEGAGRREETTKGRGIS